MGATRTLRVLTGMVLWRVSGRLKKWTDGQRVSLNGQRGQEQSSFHQGHGGQAAGRVWALSLGLSACHLAANQRRLDRSTDRPRLVPGQCWLRPQLPLAVWGALPLPPRPAGRTGGRAVEGVTMCLVLPLAHSGPSGTPSRTWPQSGDPTPDGERRSLQASLPSRGLTVGAGPGAGLGCL